MNHETTIKRIQALVPDVMALEFGCLLRNGTANIRIIKERYDGTVMINDWEGWQDRKMIEEKFEILGKPITLAVVLRAIRESQNIWLGFQLRETQLSVLEGWNLDKDNFNHQSEGTKALIGELLTDK